MSHKTHALRGRDHALALITAMKNRETATYAALLDLASSDEYVRGLIGSLVALSAPVVHRDAERWDA